MYDIATGTEVQEVKTADVLASMWTESTGASILDSGDAYGRSWQRNQAAAALSDMSPAELFLSEPQVTMDARYGYPEISVSAFHWLNEILEYDPVMQRRFDLFVALLGDDHMPWLAEAERFGEAVDESRWGLEYGYAERSSSHNTYNGETWLSDVLQYVVFDWEGETYVLLQYHGGCDVRGGYTKPRAFRVSGSEGRYELYTEGHVSLHCTEHSGEYLGEGLYGPVYDSVHAWDSNSSGIDWTEYGGAYDRVEFEVKEPEDGEPFVACPTCGAPLEVSVFFGH